MSEHKHSVIAGELQHISVSQIKTFDATTDTGCNRKWFFDKVLRFPREPPTKNQELGTEIHRQIEHYLKNNENVLGNWAREALRFLPQPRSDGLSVEYALEDLGFRIAGVPVIGAIDIVNDTGMWLDNEGIPHSLQEDEIEISDHKSTSNIAYAKTPAELLVDVQMVGYAKAATLIKPSVQNIRISHNNIGTKVKGARKITALMSRAEMTSRFEGHLVPTVAKMKEAAKLKIVEDLAPNLKACHSYNKPCPYLRDCQKDPLAQLLILTEERNTPKKESDPAPEPVPGLPEVARMSLLDKLKTTALSPVIPSAEVSVGLAPERAPKDPVLDVAGTENGQCHMGTDGQLYIWKDSRWDFAGADTKKAWTEMQVGIAAGKSVKDEGFDHSSKNAIEDLQAEGQKLENTSKRRGRPAGSKNRSLDSVPPVAVSVIAGQVTDQEAAKSDTSDKKPQEAQSIMIFIGCDPSIPSTPAEPYINQIVEHLAKVAGAPSIFQSKNEMLAFLAWKGTLRTAIHQNPPQPGAYRLLARGEPYETAGEALAELSSLVVRGSR